MNARSGYSVGNALQQGVQVLQGRVQECFNAMEDLDHSAAEIVERRSEVLLDLAKYYLPAVDQQTVAGTFQEVRGQLMDVLVRKQRRERELQETLRVDEETASRHSKELEQFTSQLNEKVAQREKLEKEVAQLLEGDEEFQRLSKEALTAEKELNRNEQRVDEIKKEAAEKLPSYEKSSLFKYLHKRGFGTSGYGKRGLTKRLDGWVAKLINYPKAKRGYEFLRVTPELMAQEVGRRRDQFNALMELVEACEDRHADEVGLTEVMREGQELGQARDKLVAEIGKQHYLTDKHRQELLALEGSRNEYYEQAVGRMKDFLAGLEKWRLEHTTRSTPDPQDDQIVAELDWLGDELDKIKRQNADLTSEQNTWKSRVGDLQDIWQRFRRADFDSGRSMFHPDFDIETHIEQFVRGQLSRDDLWASIKSAQQFAPPWHDEDDYRGGNRSVGTDFSYVLLRVLTEIAGQALRHAAERGMQRRSPIRQQQRYEAGRPVFRDGGFTRGRGF
jgi:hypothetical protein